ncbi:MAG: lantibiotic dehydratase C-terminal domain-containing protein [bacterium]|jgi:hypothetical protein
MWQTIRIVYYGDHLVGALEEPVRACIAMLRARFRIGRLMLIPHWKFGPHLDLVLDCDAVRFETEVYPRCAALFTDWLAAHPSNEEIEPTAYAALSEKLALTELERGPFLPLLPNNRVLRGDYQPSRALKLAAIAGAKEDFLCASLDLTLDLLDARRRDPDAFFLTLVAMMAVLGQSYRQGGLSRGYLSFRSHAEYFFAAYDNGEQALRRRLDQLDAATAETSASVVRSVLNGRVDELPLPDELLALMRRWEALVAATAAKNDAIVRENHARLVADDTLDRLATETVTHIPAREVERMQQRAPSAVATAMQQEAGQRVLNSQEFLSYRTTVNFFYYLLPLLGISPMKKFSLCLVVANATERALSISWEQILGIVKEEGRQRAANQ